jgi:alpha/beta hydrolase fold
MSVHHRLRLLAFPMRARPATRRWSDVGSPGSRARSVRTCQCLRPRRAVWALAISRPSVLPSASGTTSAPGKGTFAAQWLAVRSPVNASLMPSRAIVHDSGSMRFATPPSYGLAHLLLAGLPAHSALPSIVSVKPYMPVRSVSAKTGLVHRSKRFSLRSALQQEWHLEPPSWGNILERRAGHCSGSILSHRRMVTEAGRAAGVRTLAVGYRLAPEHAFPAALDDALTAWRFLRKEGIAAARIAIGGDSAGGGLTVALINRLREGDVQPACAWLVSPWTDLTMSLRFSHFLWWAVMSCLTNGSPDTQARNSSSAPRLLSQGFASGSSQSSARLDWR